MTEAGFDALYALDTLLGDVGLSAADAGGRVPRVPRIEPARMGGEFANVPNG